MAGARQIVDPPAFTSLPYGLWDAAQKPTPDNGHWQQGITWIERCPDGGTTYDECLAVTGIGAPPEPPAKADNVDQTFRGATPFTVIAEFDCSPVGLRDAETVASDALARVEQQQVEAAFWTGTSGAQTVVFPHLAADTEVLDTQGIVLQTAASPAVTGADVAQALGELEADLATCYAGQGIIHVPRVALPTLAAWNLVEERDGRLYTAAGNLVVVGGGYTGSGPDGSAPAAGTAWIYATGAVFGYRGDVQVTSPRDSIDRSSNTMRMIAERTYVIAFECCLLAAHIVLGVPTE
ncbi:MAG TPA: hypothetical protein VLB29_03485 [Nocardioidaceae bacterium]|nr:hypothetical protein [Nocardioidaceae bacterium]